MTPLVRSTIRAIALATALASASASASPPGQAQTAPETPPRATPVVTAPSPAPAPGATWVEPTRKHQPEPAPVPATQQVARENYRMVLAGNIITGLGLGAFIAMTTGFLIASDARDRLGFASVKDDADEVAKQQARARRGNIVGITGAAATGALLITGLTLIGVGRTRERKRREALETSMVVPYAVPGSAGLLWKLRF